MKTFTPLFFCLLSFGLLAQEYTMAEGARNTTTSPSLIRDIISHDDGFALIGALRQLELQGDTIGLDRGSR